MDPGIPPDPIGSQGIPLDSTGFHGPRLVQMVDGSFESFWIHCACGPYGSYRISTACCCLIGPRVSLDAGIPPDPTSHRIPLDPRGSRWIPLGSTGLAGYTWSTDPPGSYWIHCACGPADPIWAHGPYRISTACCCLTGPRVSLDAGIPPDPIGSHQIPLGPIGFHALLS